jgi:hypothetical protein
MLNMITMISREASGLAAVPNHEAPRTNGQLLVNLMRRRFMNMMRRRTQSTTHPSIVFLMLVQ